MIASCRQSLNKYVYLSYEWSSKLFSVLIYYNYQGFLTSVYRGMVYPLTINLFVMSFCLFDA